MGSELALSLTLLFLPDIAVSRAVRCDVQTIELHRNGRVTAHAVLRYLPDESVLGSLCPRVLKLPAGGEPWSWFNQQSYLRVSGIPDQYKSDRRIQFFVIEREPGISIKAGDEIFGVFELTYHFKYPLDRQKLVGDSAVKLKLQGRMEFYSVAPAPFRTYTSSGLGFIYRSRAQLVVQSGLVPLSLAGSD